MVADGDRIDAEELGNGAEAPIAPTSRHWSSTIGVGSTVAVGCLVLLVLVVLVALVIVPRLR